MARFNPDYREELRLANGVTVQLRPVRPEDKALLEDGFERLSKESRYARFLTPRRGFTSQELQFLTEVDGVDHFAIGATVIRVEGGEEGVGVARFVRVPGEPDVAEPAVTIIDEYQGLGLGTALLARLVAAARERGVQRLRCLFLAENRQIRALLDDYADHATQHRDREMLTMEIPIPEPRPQERIRDLVRAGPMQRALRDTATGSMSLRPDDDDDQP